MKSPRILIINPFGIGDVVFSTPLIEILKTAYPGSFIGYVCNKRSYEVIRSAPNIDKIFTYEKDDYRDCWQRSKIACLGKIFDFLKTIKAQKFDIAIDLSLGYQYSFLLKLIGIRQRIGFNFRKRGKFLTKKIDMNGFNDKHVIEYYCDIVKLLGVDSGTITPSPKIYLTAADRVWADGFLKASGAGEGDVLIGVIPGCGASWGVDASYRRWEREGFAKVCDGAVERYGAKVILLGDPKEVGICEEIQGMLKNKAIMACGKTSLRDFLGLISRCRLVITNDGGPLHMAVGLGLNTISIFGPVDEMIYGPYPPSANHIVISKSGLACRPCYRKFKYTRCEDRVCLKKIAPEEVLGAVDRLLSPKAVYVQ